MTISGKTAVVTSCRKVGMQLTQALRDAHVNAALKQVARDLGMGFRLPDWFRAQA